MANRTAKDAKSVKGTNPQYLLEKIIRMRIYDSKFWKEECFGLSAELMVDKAMELRYVGGTYAGNVKPAPFLCLVLKLLQIQPDKDIIIEFIRREDFKYVRALGAFYLRLTSSSPEIFKYLEPLYNDYRKLRWMGNDGKFSILHMDEFIDQLLREERCCDIQMPRLQKREYLEESTGLAPRISALEEDLEALSDDEEEKPAPPVEKERERRRDDRPERSERDRDRPRRSPSPRRRRSPAPRERRRSPVPRERRRSPERSGRSDRGSDRLMRKGERERRAEKERKRGHENSEEKEISEANAVRKSLGLAPLQR